MQLSNTISLLSPLLLLLASTSSASAVSAPELGFLSKRQAPGTPKFECHSNCGTAIKLTKASTGDEACANSELQKLYTACTACAEEEGIWQYYGPSLSKLSSCNWGSEESKNDDATPVGQNTTATPTNSNSTILGGAGNSTRPSSTPTPTQVAGDSAGAMNGVNAFVGLGAIIVGVAVMTL